MEVCANLDPESASPIHNTPRVNRLAELLQLLKVLSEDLLHRRTLEREVVIHGCILSGAAFLQRELADLASHLAQNVKPECVLFRIGPPNSHREQKDHFRCTVRPRCWEAVFESVRVDGLDGRVDLYAAVVGQELRIVLHGESQ